MKDVVIPKAIQEMRSQRAFFNAEELPSPLMKYVAWIDIMGTDSIMRRSMPIAANFLAKLHTAALQVRGSLHTPEDLKLYSLVDGLYIASQDQHLLLRQLTRILKQLAVTFICEEDPLHQFMVRACIAFGPLWEGEALATGSHRTLRDNLEHTRQILLGPCVTQAFTDERKASPYGVWVHESARAFSPPDIHPLTFTHWHWWLREADQDAREIASTLRQHLLAYLQWCSMNHTYLMYPEHRIKAHTELVKQYFYMFAAQEHGKIEHVPDEDEVCGDPEKA